MWQVDAEKAIYLLVTVRELIRLQHQHGIWQVIQYLGERVARLLRLDLHDKELSQYISGKVDREKDARPPHGNLHNRNDNLTLHTKMDAVGVGCSEADWGHNEIHKPIIAKRRHPQSQKYVNVGDILFYSLDYHKMLDLFLYGLFTDLFIIEAPNHPRMDRYAGNNSHC